ncbi:hypothetical protein HDK90DRAFT_482844 [Phyllosticta capitalensis]|uniref:Secreted protein n=1 Tax=Phyllosticta capitalensis TaxID=121624 RepID=A0ABR1YTI5_9PEZI
MQRLRCVGSASALVLLVSGSAVILLRGFRLWNQEFLRRTAAVFVCHHLRVLANELLQEPGFQKGGTSPDFEQVQSRKGLVVLQKDDERRRHHKRIFR